VVDGRGQWRDGERIAAEPSRILVVIHSSIHPPGAEADQALKAIRAEYRRRFAQQSVLRVDRGVAASF